MDALLTTARPALDAATLDPVISRGVDALLRWQRGDGHWVFELEADATIPAEYVLLKHYLGEGDELGLEPKIAAYLRRTACEGGGWPLFYDGPVDVSASVKAYFALKVIGDSPIRSTCAGRARPFLPAEGPRARMFLPACC